MHSQNNNTTVSKQVDFVNKISTLSIYFRVCFRWASKFNWHNTLTISITKYSSLLAIVLPAMCLLFYNFFACLLFLCFSPILQAHSLYFHHLFATHRIHSVPCLERAAHYRTSRFLQCAVLRFFSRLFSFRFFLSLWMFSVLCCIYCDFFSVVASVGFFLCLLPITSRLFDWYCYYYYYSCCCCCCRWNPSYDDNIFQLCYASFATIFFFVCLSLCVCLPLLYTTCFLSVSNCSTVCIALWQRIRNIHAMQQHWGEHVCVRALCDSKQAKVKCTHYFKYIQFTDNQLKLNTYFTRVLLPRRSS